MNGGRSDASTSTDDVKSRPLCLFYFTHPFGVLSAEPPTLAAAPPHIARAFLNMEPVPPWTLWSPAPAPPPPAEPSADDYNSASSSRLSYELGAATVHRTPLSLVSVTRTRKCTLDFGNSRDSVSSSLFSSDMWFNSSSSCRSNEYPRRLVPYNKILPPLQLPSPKDSSNLSSCDDFWPKKYLNPEKFSLPPIELPSVKVNIVRSKKCSASSEEASSAEWPASRYVRARRRLGVSKPRRARAADLRRLLAKLIRRALAVPPVPYRTYSGNCSADSAEDRARLCSTPCTLRQRPVTQAPGARRATGGDMGYLLDRCPEVYRCWFLPLRQAALLAGLLGLAWAAMYLFLYSAPGARLVARGAGDGQAAGALRYAHGALGVLLLALHAMLLVGVRAESDWLCDVYIWGMLTCWVGLVAAAITFAGAAVLTDQLMAASLVLFGVLLSVLVSVYFVVVVINYRLTMP